MRRTIIVVASLLLAVSVYVADFALWASRAVIDQEAFVASAVTSFGAEGSDEALGSIITDKVVERYPALVLFEGPLGSVFAGLVRTPAFAPALRDVSLQVHEVVVGGAELPVTIDLGEYREVVLGAVAAFSPALASQVPEDVFGTFTVFDAGDIPDASARARDAERVAVAAVALAMLIAVGLVMYLRNGTAWLTAVGLAILAAGAATVLIVPAARSLSSMAIADEAYRVLTLNLYDEVVRGLLVRGVLLIIAGASMVLVALASLGLSRRVGNA